eukprot:4844062-Prymnesium_polylepis.1
MSSVAIGSSASFEWKYRRWPCAERARDREKACERAPRRCAVRHCTSSSTKYRSAHCFVIGFLCRPSFHSQPSLLTCAAGRARVRMLHQRQIAGRPDATGRSTPA